MTNQLNTDTKLDISTELVETWKRVLAELVEKAQNDSIRNCLRLYDPEKPSEDNIKALKSCRKGPIIETLNFLAKTKIEDLKKDEAIDKLCLKIKNYFPDICQICDQSYTVKFDDKFLMKCGSCGQEVHRPCYIKLLKTMNLLDENEELRNIVYNIPGMYYLCPSCQNETINFPTYIPNTRTNITSSIPSPTKPLSPVPETNGGVSLTPRRILPTPKRTLHPLPLSPNVILDNRTHKNLSEAYLGRTEFMKNKFRRDLENNSSLTSENVISEIFKDKETPHKNNETLLKDNDRVVCRFYKRGKCKFGIRGKKCQYNHPKACPKLMKHGNKGPYGCTAGTKCTEFHPRMCSSSINKRECFNEVCTFAHVKGTKRKPANVKNNHTEFQGQSDFLKILDNFRVEMISLINENVKPRLHQQISSTFPHRQPTQTTLQLPNLQTQQRHFNLHHQGTKYPMPQLTSLQQ